MAVPAVEDLAVEHNDGVPKPVFPDVVGKFLEFGLAKLGEQEAGGVIGVMCGFLVAAFVRFQTSHFTFLPSRGASAAHRRVLLDRCRDLPWRTDVVRSRQITDGRDDQAGQEGPDRWKMVETVRRSCRRLTKVGSD